MIFSVYNRLLNLGSVVPDERDNSLTVSSVNDEMSKGKSVSEQVSNIFHGFLIFT